MVMVLTIAVCHSAGKVDNWNLGRADFQLRFSSKICFPLPTDWNLRAYMCAFILRLLVMIAMVMIAMVMIAMVMMANVDHGDDDDSEC
jgi:hypothetical protein